MAQVNAQNVNHTRIKENQEKHNGHKTSGKTESYALAIKNNKLNVENTKTVESHGSLSRPTDRVCHPVFFSRNNYLILF